MYTLDIEDPDKLFFTSDMHLNHFNICKYCDRPFVSRAEMNQTLIDNWNSVVPEDGIVINCGDFTLTHEEDLKTYQKLASKLNGTMLLVRGNHDRVPLSIESTGKFIAIVDIATINVEGVKILASHYPILAFPTDYQVFGHIHTLKDGTCHGVDGDVNAKLRWNQYDIGVDQNNYKPVSYWELAKKYKDRRTHTISYTCPPVTLSHFKENESNQNL